MSALGQKQTFAAQKIMSALPPKADMCAATRNVRFVPKADIANLFDNLVSTCEHGRRHGEAEGLGRLEIDHQLVLCRRLHRKIGWLLALEDAINIAGSAPELIKIVRPVRQQAATFDEGTDAACAVPQA